MSEGGRIQICCNDPMPERNEYTNEELPMGHVRRAMSEELECFCDRVWVGVPMGEAKNDPDGKIMGPRWVKL